MPLNVLCHGVIKLQPRSQGSLLPALRSERGWVGENPGNEVDKIKQVWLKHVGFLFFIKKVTQRKRFHRSLQLEATWKT